MDMCERIKELRKAKGYTQQDLARKLGLIAESKHLSYIDTYATSH